LESELIGFAEKMDEDDEDEDEDKDENEGAGGMLELDTELVDGLEMD